MTNAPRSAVLYTGITGDLLHRVWHYKHKTNSGFASRYNLTHLVYYGRFFDSDAAMIREKETRGWPRRRKIKQIESVNPSWNDLGREWESVYKPETSPAQLDPSPRWRRTRGFGMTPVMPSEDQRLA